MHWLKDHLEFLYHAAIGGLVTSLAEFLFSYNLVDLLLDKVKGLLGKNG